MNEKNTEEIVREDSFCKNIKIEEAKKIENTVIKLNKILHSHEISAHHRCTLIGAILLALEDDGFRVSYKADSKSGEKPNPKKLTKRILDGVKNVLVEKKIDKKRSETIKKIYSVIETFYLSREEKVKKGEDNYVVRDIIDLLERNIYPLTQNGEKGYDVFGRFYTEFVKHTSSDKKNGIVLTPQHITELFCEIASLHVDSIILDPCCGTGGFLVSAMKYMLNQTNDNEIKNRIKEKQLIGIEKEAEMFCFACSNMILSGDGKTNIHHGDCFSEKEKDIIKDLKPNIAFLNPPYKAGDAEKQLEFIENACDLLEKNGTCVAIVQFSCAISKQKNVLLVKERLLKKHKLKAVFSMPDELFTPVGVVTCIIVLQSHTPHDKNSKTFFGYFKDDGFVKTKKGRIDQKNQWHKIKEHWLQLYKNNEEQNGLSLKKEVSFDDEWCAEAYMVTDYAKLKKEDFIKTIQNFTTYKFLNNL